jgi:hypothetical protein
MDDPMSTPYMNRLLAEPEQSQVAIETLLEECQVTPVGKGYIDLIIARSRAHALIDELAHLPVAVRAVTWWCLCTAETESRLGCPHGVGGPTNPFGEGWLTECVHIPWFNVTDHGVALDDSSVTPEALTDACRRVVCEYIDQGLAAEGFDRACMQPGLWLHVPRHWVRQRYFAR